MHTNDISAAGTFRLLNGRLPTGTFPVLASKPYDEHQAIVFANGPATCLVLVPIPDIVSGHDLTLESITVRASGNGVSIGPLIDAAAGGPYTLDRDSLKAWDFEPPNGDEYGRESTILTIRWPYAVVAAFERDGHRCLVLVRDDGKFLFKRLSEAYRNTLVWISTKQGPTGFLFELKGPGDTVEESLYHQ